MGKLILIVVLAGISPILARASGVPVNYTGHYELADSHPERVFTFDLDQSGSRVWVVFFAAVLQDPDADQPARQHLGEGKGRVNDQGVLEFTFKDSFGNEGSATFEPSGRGFRVEMRITKFVNPAPLHFYGALIMRKTSDKPSSGVSSG